MLMLLVTQMRLTFVK